MKRILVFIIAIALVFSNTSAFANDVDPLERIAELEEQLKEKDERIAELENQVNVLLNLLGGSSSDNGLSKITNQDEQKKETIVETISLNETITYQDLEIILNKIQVADHITIPYGASEDTNTIWVYRPVESKDGNKLIIVSGKIKNNGKQELFTFGNIFTDFIIDESDSHGGEVTLAQTTSGGAHIARNLAAQEEAMFFCTVELPETLAENFTTCNVKIGFHREGFSTTRFGATMNDANTCFLLTASKSGESDNPILVEKIEPTVYHLGDAISVETLDLQFTEIVIKNEMREEYNGRGYRETDPAEGTHNICLVGSMVNKAKRPLKRTDFTGNVEIDGYTYGLESWVFDGYNLQPMMKTKVFLYANVPDSVLENIEKATFKFAFNEEMSNHFFEYEECDYHYIFTIE